MIAAAALFICLQASGAPLEVLALRVAKGVSLEPPVLVSVQGPDDMLRRAFEGHLASALAAKALSPVVAEHHGAVHSSARSMLRVEISLVGTKLVARGEGRSIWVNFWAGNTPTQAVGSISLAESIEADESTRLLLGGMSQPVVKGPLVLTLVPFAGLPAQPAALATGDVDGDGLDEVAVVVGDEVRLLSSSGALLAKAALNPSPVASAITREPFGAAWVGSKRVIAWSARRQKAVVFDVSASGLVPSGVVSQVPMGPLSLTLEPGVNRYQPAVSATTTFERGPQAIDVSGPMVLAQFDDGSASLLRPGKAAGTMTGVGCGLGFIDVDGDGQVEVLVTDAKRFGDEDAMRLVPLSAFEADAGQVKSPTWWQSSVTKGRVLMARSAKLDTREGSEMVLGLWHSDGSGSLMVLRRP